jgi:hypothetical protein
MLGFCENGDKAASQDIMLGAQQTEGIQTIGWLTELLYIYQHSAGPLKYGVACCNGGGPATSCETERGAGRRGAQRIKATHVPA